MKSFLGTLVHHHPLTDRGLAGFLKDWEKTRGVPGDIMVPAVARQAGR